MNPIKQAILSTYYHGSLPLRCARNRLLARAGRAPIMVVCFHRIADDAANAWTTRNDLFKRGIDWLQRNFDLVSLEEAQDRIRSARNDRAAVSITFDDGYAENCDRALPLLMDRQIPFTYFVTTNAVLGGEFFGHDLETGRRFPPNTLNQIKLLSEFGVEIGGHSRSHCNLGAIRDEAELHDEIVGSARDLESEIGRPVRYFAFPFGQHANLNRRAFEIAAEAGMQGVVSAYGGYNFPGDDAFHMQRMAVDGPLVRLKNWTTLDAYKQLKIQKFQYRVPAAVVAAQGGEAR